MQQTIPEAAYVSTPYICRTQCSYPLSKEHSLVLSEYLKDKAVWILVDDIISDSFPKQCDEWRSATTDTRKTFQDEMKKKQEMACQDLSSQETSLRRALLDAVIDDVIRLFPCVLSQLSGHSTVC
jgi:hypothetical protein